MGYTVDDSAGRLSNYLHVLRELVHLHSGHLPLEPRFEVKALLADHLHDDARAVSNVARRAHELGRDDPGAPAPELGALLDRAGDADTAGYLQIAYGELKPALIAALRIHLAQLDPLIDEPSLRVLTQLLHRQERHTAELPAGGAPPIDDLGALPTATGARTLKVMPRVTRPARDAFIEVTDGPEPHREHALMNAELCAAELSARSSHEHPEMPWDFHVDMARQAWDELRHAEVYDRRMSTELDCHWGDHPVAFARFDERYALDLADRLARYRGPSEGTDDDYLRADEVVHAEIAARWAAHLRQS
jgi:hypothetical protein